MKNKTGDKALDHWLDFFKGEKNNIKFISLLKKLDKTFLTSENNFDFEHPAFEQMPKWGFLEKDVHVILKSFSEEGENCIEEKTRLVIAAAHEVSFKPWVSIYKEELHEIFGKSLVEGKYEEYGIDLDKIISSAITNNLISRSDFMAIAMLRGVILQNRYPDEEAEKKLEKVVKSNKNKIRLLSFVMR